MLDVLFEDNHCIAVEKPVGWPTTHYSGAEETLDRLVKSYLKDKYRKPGNVFLGVVHRLDKPVSGVLLFARTSKSAARLSEQFRQGSIEKVYWAVVERGTRSAGRGTKNRASGAMPPAGTLEDWLRKDQERGVVEVTAPHELGSKQALLHFQTKATHDGLALLEVRPQTGRTHQLRVQLAHHGWPIYGDRKYGSPHVFGPGIGLHARSLTFLHPTRNEPITLLAEVPKAWRGRFAHLLKGRAP
jgi:23S rRNA pseudouridine1911/1915/1917 synthase